MRCSSLIRNCIAAALCGLLYLLAAFAATTTPTKKTAKTSSASTSTSTTHKKHSRTKGKGKSSKTRGQKAIESERAHQIQEALIREHYMEGQPSGKWDDATQAALRRYQADQGWQSKSVPDSRALIKLGLGPSHDHLLNPETAMTNAPANSASPSPKPAAANPHSSPSSDATPHR
jgi:hypothetical protein